jgi:hypothetical protein
VLEVKYSIQHNVETNEGNIVKLVNERFVKGLSTENRPESKPKLGENVQHVLVESEAN